MAAPIANVNPKNNPLAIKIPINTVISGIVLNPVETYNVTIDKIINVANVSTPKFALIYALSNNFNVRYLKLSDTFFYKIYLPLWDNGNIIYLVPAFYDPAYADQGVRDMTNILQKSPVISSTVYTEPNTTWGQALESWIYDMNGYKALAVNKQPTKTTTISKDITFTITGYVSKRVDETIKTKATFKALAKRLGV